MIRILVFAILVLALGFGFSWLADRPGELTLLWEGRIVEMSLLAAAGFTVALVAAVLVCWWLLSGLWNSPHTINRYFRARKRDRGYQALSTGLIAAGAGNSLLAAKMAARSRGLISADQEPLIHLLEAQTALIEGKHDDARRKFELMADDPETRELGLRGLYLEAKRLGADEAARQYAEQAAEKAPYLPWAAQAALDYRSQAGLWNDAIRLLDQQRVAHVFPKAEAERKKAVLLTARAAAALEADPKTARQDALAALKLAPSLAPAALIAAKSYFREDNVRKASSVLEQAWKQAPSSEIATTYLRARSGDSALDRLKRAERLEALKPNNIESLLAVARAALDTKDFSRARQKAEAAARMDARESVFLLLADIEEAETGDQGRIRHWLGQALRAPRDPAWVADGFVSETWLPVSPVSGRLDAFEWKAPFHQIAARIEDGTLAEDALQTLPPLPEKTVSEPPKPAAVPAIIDAEPVVKPVPQAMKPAPSPAEARPTPEPVAANSSRAPDPFNGRPPDDPGVKFAEADSGEKTRLRLF